MNDAVKVVFIIGWVRGGSTLLDVMLGELDGFFSAGEVRYIWDRGLQRGWMCGCGKPLPECEVWTSVIRDAFGVAPDEVPSHQIAQLHLELVRSKRLPKLLRQTPGPGYEWKALDDYVSRLGALYRSIGKTSGANVVIDSSKFAQDAAITRLVPGIDAYFVHIVRDPRAVAYSNLRDKTSQPDPKEPVEMAKWSPRQSATRWTRFHMTASAVRARHDSAKTMLLRYEDLIRSPRATIETIAAMVEEPVEGLRMPDASSIELRGNHTVWGNPARFKRGTVALRVDDEWERELSVKDRRLVTALTFPLMKHYGYSLR